MKELKLTDEYTDQLNDFIVKKIQNKELSFNELFDKYKNCDSSEVLRSLLDSGLFEALLENKLLSKEELIDVIKIFGRITSYFGTSELMFASTQLIGSIQESFEIFGLDSFARSEEFIDKLRNEKLLTKEILMNIWNSIDKEDSENKYDILPICENLSLLQYMIEDQIFSFKEFVDVLKKEHYDYAFGQFLEYIHPYAKYRKGRRDFLELFEKTLTLDNSDLYYLMKSIPSEYKLSEFFINLSDHPDLTRYMLKNFLFDKPLVEKFDELLKDEDEERSRSFFELLKFYSQTYIEYGLNDARGGYYWEEFDVKGDPEISKFLDLNIRLNKLPMFDKDSQIELIELLKNSDVAQERLKYITDNHLESNYTFEELMQYLKKIDKKNILSI